MIFKNTNFEKSQGSLFSSADVTRCLFKNLAPELLLRRIHPASTEVERGRGRRRKGRETRLGRGGTGGKEGKDERKERKKEEEETRRGRGRDR